MAATNSAFHRSSSPLMLLLFAAVVTACIGTFLWAQFYRVVPAADFDIRHTGTGFNTPVEHHLDPKFNDSTGSLLADPPSDPSQLVDPPTLRFAYIEQDDPAKQKAAWKPFMDYLSRETGKPVQYQLLAGSNDLLKAMHDGRLDVAGFNTGSVPTAVNVCGFIPVCAIPTMEGTALTRTVIIVPATSDIQSPADLRGHELTLTEIGSNSGYKAPLVLLRSEFGLEPLRDVMLRYSGSHEASIEGIASGEYDAAAVAEDMLSRETSAGKIKPDQYRVIYSSEAFPTAGLGYVYNLKPELAAKIKDALLTFDWKGTPLEQMFSGAKQTKFLPVNYKNDWSLIRRIDDEMGVDEKIH
ncbi:MAG TPA: phosphate/phosphite/phosphonate ABC transporter substrate-binding protein [Tepidisphaeraceae bacterium]|nr:phosphate/phosphite/phosphonate ABC transporter substrate-binding protein [Tepidisphaeraceae bacterium]